jgi:DNA-binding NarL/FixJ family response regulator
VAEVRLYREGLSTSLGRREHLAVLGEAGSREAALALVASNPPDVVVLDMATRDSLAIVRAISSAAPSVKIIASPSRSWTVRSSRAARRAWQAG